jgi:hypothetical protein
MAGLHIRIRAKPEGGGFELDFAFNRPFTQAKEAFPGKICRINLHLIDGWLGIFRTEMDRPRQGGYDNRQI